MYLVDCYCEGIHGQELLIRLKQIVVITMLHMDDENFDYSVFNQFTAMWPL